MSAILALQPFVQRVGWTLLHFLWQGTAIAVLYMLIRGFLGRTLSPPARYRLACAALLIMVIAPPLTYLAISSAPLVPSEFAAWSLSLSVGKWLPSAFVTFWAVGVVGFSIRLFGAFRFTRRLRVTSQPAPPEWQQTLHCVALRMGTRAASARLMISSLVNVPVVIGWLKPLILVPAGALAGLPAEHLHALLVHELAHIRRNDFLVGILQSLAEIALFYHPAVWWISAQMRAERELCCDDLVIAGGTDVLTYARALTELESRRPLRLNPQRLKPQMAADGGSLTERIRRLIDPAHLNTHCVPRAGSACAMILLLFLGTGALAFAGAQKPLPASHTVGFNAAPHPDTLPLPVSPATLASHARDTLLFDPVLTAQLAPPRPPAVTPAVSPDDLTAELPIAVEVNYFRQNNAESYTTFALVIPGDFLAQARRTGAERTQLDLTGDIKDEAGVTVQHIGVQKDIGIAWYVELANRQVEQRFAFTLLPGNYSLNLTAHDSTTNRSGTWASAFNIPNLNKEDQRIPITSVVLGGQRAIDSVGTNSYLSPQNPLVHDGQELVPSVTRVFSSQNDISVYLQAFEKGATATQPLVASVTLLKDSVKVVETPQVAVSEGMDPRSKMLPIKLSVPLSRLTPGNYICQVTVLDPATQKTASWQAPVTVTP